MKYKKYRIVRNNIQSTKVTITSPISRLKSLVAISGFALLAIAMLLLPKQAKAFSGSGAGSIGDPFVITTCTQLQEMADDLAGNYSLGSDIDCSDTINWNTGKGFDPVGWYDYDNDIGYPFTGTLNGNNHTIDSLTIIRANDTPNDNDPEDEFNVGLFGNTNSAVVSNLNITSSKIKGHINVGGIIGQMNGGQLLNSTFNATSTPNDCTPGYCVWARYGYYGGGLVGYLDGGEIANSHTAGSVRGSGSYIGGLVGIMYSGNLHDSYSTASADGGSQIGGAIGYLQGGTVSHIYATGLIHAVDDELPDRSGRDLGGLIGSMWGGEVANAYATGVVNADVGSAGGFVGFMGGGVISNAYSSGTVTSASPDDYYGTGGFAGDVYTYNGDTLIQNSFSVSSVNSTKGAGGFAGRVENDIPPNSSPVYPEQLVNVRYDVTRSGYNYCYSQPISGSGPGQFNYPIGAATDSSGNVYVVDSNNNRIQKFTSTGTYITQWGSAGTGNSQFEYPTGITIDGTGDVYVVDSNNDRIQKFTSTGTYITQWGSAGTGNGEFESAFGITTDSSGNVYVVDSNNNRIQKFTSTGTYITQWGSAGTGNGEFSYPTDITIDINNNVYVVDPSNNRIQKFTSTGTYITQWGSYGAGNSQFDYPYGIASDSNGDIYVSDTNNNRIQKFTSTGTYITQWGSYGAGNGQFQAPLGIAPSTDGDIYVVDNSGSRIEKFTNTGTYISQISGPTIGNTGCNQVNAGGSNPGYFYDYGNNPFTISNARVWPANVWLFSGSAYPVFCDTNNCQSVLPPNADNDGDGITNGIEDAAPNGGDGNNDGTLDALQAHVTSYTSQSTNGYVTIIGPNGSQLTAVNSQPATNTNYSFPFGLVGFTLSGITTGSTAQITMLFPSSRNPSDLLARKYFPSSQSYLDIPGATTSTVTIASQPTLQLVYGVTDGSNLDLDGVANGSITDPVGLADRNSVSLANTGENSYIVMFSALVLIVTGGYLVRRNTSLLSKSNLS